MKLRSQTVFPIALLLLLVGLTFWLKRATEAEGLFSDSLLRHDPDYFAENFTVRRFDKTGLLQNRMTAKRMVHYPDDDTSVVAEPKILFLKGPRPTHLSANQGLIASDAREVVLIGNVRSVREATQTDPEIVLTTSRLTIFPDDEVTRTDAAVTITQGPSIIRGVGMEADNKTLIYQMNQVNSTIEKKRLLRP